MATFTLSGTAAGTYPNYTADPTSYSPDYNGIIQTDTFNLTTEPMVVRLTGQAVAGGVDGECGLIIEVNTQTPTSQGDPNRVWFQIYNPPTPTDIMEANYAVAGSQSKVFSLPLAEYLRLIVSGGNLLWQTSPNGTTWTTRRTVPTSSLPDLTSVKLGVYTYGSNASGLYSFSVVSPAVTPTTTVPAAPSVTAVRSATDPTVLTVTWTQGSNGGSAVLDQEITLDGVVIATVGASTSTYTVTSATFSSHVFSVRVRNAEGYSAAGTSATIPVYSPPSVGLQQLGAVADDFNDTSLDGQWVTSAGVTQTGGQVVFPAPGTTPAEIYRRGSAVGQAVFFKVTPVPGTDVTTEFFLRQTSDRTQKVSIFIRDGVLYAANEQGAADASQSARPYSATQDLYLRILNGTDGRTRLYASPDAGIWTELGRSNFISPPWLADVEVGVRVFVGTTATIPVVVPLAPASTSATNVTSTTARVSWTPPTNAAAAGMGQSGTGYQVSWGGWTSGLVPATERFMDLTNFPAGATTPVEVWAVGTAGRGPSATQNVVTPASNPSTGNPALLGVPSKVMGLYSTAWGAGIDTNTPPTSFNLQYLFHAEPTASGAFTWNYSIPRNMSTARARGTRLILTTGGANAGFQFTNRTQSTAFVDSIVAINTQFGGTLANPAFDGLDFNNFEGQVVPNFTEMGWIAQELRVRFGANFMITCPPAPWRQSDKDFCAAMLAAGNMTYAAPQFYDGPGLADPAAIVSYVDDWVANVAGGDASKIVVGFGVSPGAANYSTTAQIESAWRTIESRHPSIRGAFIWDREGEARNGWAAVGRLSPLVLS